MEHRCKENSMRLWSGYASLEEDLLEDTEPELIDISLSGSCSSHKSSLMTVPHSISPRAASDSDSSVNTCISPQPVKLCTRKKLSLSLHDISEFPEHAIHSSKSKSQSMTALTSARPLREAALPRSNSAQSRISSTRRYDHVQSKVKEYIRNIKAETARNRKLRASREALNKVHVEQPPKRSEVDELKQRLSDSELYISHLQNNYQELLVKHAVAQRTIDEMRNRTQNTAAVQTVVPISPLPKSYTSTLKLKVSPANSLVVLDSEQTAPSKVQLDVDTGVQDDIISKVKRWQESLSSSSPHSSLDQVVEEAKQQAADSGYGGSVPNVMDVPPLKLGSLLDSTSSTMSCSSSHSSLKSVIAALQSLYEVPDSASTSYRSIQIQHTIDSLAELKAREICKEHMKLSSEDKRTLLKCLDDLNVFAEQVKSRSEAVRSILTQRLRSTK